jgi:PAS domain S-box-containing protein
MLTTDRGAMTSPQAVPAAGTVAPAVDAELAALLAISTVGVLGWGETGLIDRANEALLQWLGPLPRIVDALPEGLRMLLGVDEGPALGGRDDEPLLRSGGVRERSGWVVMHDGRRLHLRVRVRAVPGAGGGRCLAVIEDCSIEDERDLARMEMGALMESADVGVATFDTAHGWLDGAPPSGPSAANRVGLQRISREVVEPASLPAYERLQQALRHGERAEVRYAVRHPEAGRRWLLTRVEPGALAEGRATMSVVTRDVTEQELAQRRNERLLRELQTILDASAAGIGFFRSGRLVRCNGRFESLLALGSGDADGMTLDQLLLACGATPGTAADARQTLHAAGSFEADLALRSTGNGTRSGGARWVSLSLRLTRPDDDLETVAVITDITPLKQQQAAVEAMARERELMFDLSDVGIAYERGGRIGRANQALAELSLYSRSELLAMPVERLYESADVYAQLAPMEQRDLQRFGRFHGERRIRRGDGSLLWVQATRRVVDPADPAAGTIWSFVDVDERRRAREALLLQADRTRAVLDSVLVGIVTVGAGGIEWMNRSARRMFGGELADFVGEPIATVATAEIAHPLRRTDFTQTLQDGQSEAFECRLMARDGRRFWVAANVVATGTDPQSRQLTYALMDIDRRRQAELNVAQARASMQRIIETAPLAIALFDAPTRTVLQLNQTMAAFAGVPVSQIDGRPLSDWLDAADAAALDASFEQALRSGDTVRSELRRDLSSGPRIWDVRCVSLGATDTASEQVLLVASDVTEQREEDRARLDAAIAQREILIREVHHRIKNNLQGVAGLLQQSALRLPQAASAIAEAVAQVHAIAQVHGLQVGQGGTLDVVGVLEAIAASVQRMFGRTISVEVNGVAMHRFALAEQDSIAVALSINELLTNAIKHGQGDVRCRLQAEGAGVALEIASRSVLPAGFSLTGLRGGPSGLSLVRALLPRKGAALSLQQLGDDVVARIGLEPPALAIVDAPPPAGGWSGR